METRNARARLVRYALWSVAAGWVIVGIDLIVPAWTPLIVAELGPAQIAQATVLGAAVGLLLSEWRRGGGLSHPAGPPLMACAGLAAALCWREIELDNELFGIHLFSWKYFGDPQVPLWLQAAGGIISVGLPGLVLVYVFWRGWAPWRNGVRMFANRLLIGAAVLLALSQLWDKGGTLADRFGIPWFLHLASHPNPIPEEVCELLAEMLVLFAACEAVRQARVLGMPAPDAAAVAGETSIIRRAA